jgi:hypothetical protein
MPNPGERQIERGREFKDNTGSSPNGVANKWLAQRRGCEVAVQRPGQLELVGELIGFDAYSVLIRVEVAISHDDSEPMDMLIFKGPGVTVVGDVSDSD